MLAAVAFGEVAAQRARDAVLRLAPEDAADLASRWSPGRVVLDERATASDERTRILELCLSILGALRERGHDVDHLCRHALEDRSRSSLDVGILAIACLRAHPGELPAELVPLLSRAVEQGWWSDALLEHVRALPEASLDAILGRARRVPAALPFFALRG